MFSDFTSDNTFSLDSVDPNAPLLTDGQTAAIASAVQAFIDQMNAAKTQVQTLNTALYAAVSNMSSASNLVTGGKTAASGLVDTWHTQALSWMNQATQIVTDVQAALAAGDLTIATSEVNNWISWGSGLLAQGKQVGVSVATLNSSLFADFGPALSQLWQAALNAAAQAAVTAIQAAATVINAGTSALLTPILLVGLGLAALLWLFDQSSGGRAAVSAAGRAAKTAALAGYKRRRKRMGVLYKGPHLSHVEKMSDAEIDKLDRVFLLQWLKRNDPNGDYDADNSGRALPLSYLREEVKNQRNG